MVKKNVTRQSKRKKQTYKTRQHLLQTVRDIQTELLSFEQSSVASFHMSDYLRSNGVIPLWEQLSMRHMSSSEKRIDDSLLLTDVRCGFERGEFICLYQPQWCLKTGRLIAIETDVRWQHPKKGLMGSDFFLPFFEEHNLTEDFIYVLIERILTDKLQVTSTGIKDFLTILKFSSAQLETPYLAQLILRQFEKEHILPSEIECQLNDRQFVKNVSVLRQNLIDFQQANVSLSLGKFGSGYSGYPYLQEFHFNKIKLEKNYLINVFQNPRAQMIIQSVINMARMLNASAVMDGVNDVQILKWLQMIDCDIGQGCYIGGFMFLEDLVDFLTEYRKIQHNGKKAIMNFWQQKSNKIIHLSPDC